MVVEDAADRLRRRGGPRRVRPDGARGPARPHQTVPGRPRIPDRRQAGHPHRAARRRRRRSPTRTASGSVAVPGARAKVALASRIYVEGRHDAELVEQVWGDDLRIEGVVVEYLGGVDDLVGHRRRLPARPGPPARCAGRPPGRRLQGGPHRRRPSAADRAVPTRSSSDIPSSTSGRRSSPPGSGSRRGRSCRAAVDWKHGVCAGAGLAAHATRPTSPAPGSGSGAGCGTGTISSRR